MTKPTTPPNGILLVFSGPSGAGKTSITRPLIEHFPDAVFSVSATTRDKTEHEVNDVDYHFLTTEQFDQHIHNDDFLEHAQYAGNFYGTLRAPIEEALSQGKLVVLDIDIQGANSVKSLVPEAYFLFIQPPNDEVLLERLRARKRENEEIIQRRFKEAKREIVEAHGGTLYDVFITNNDLQTAIERTIEVIEKELASRAATA